MHTRTDYTSGMTGHREYYGQFVNEAVKRIVMHGIGKNLILQSTDPHMNDIRLPKWDRLKLSIISCCGGAISKANGGGGISLSDTVCVAKEAARQIQEDYSCNDVGDSPCEGVYLRFD